MRKLTLTLATAACALIVSACQDTTEPVALEEGSGGSGSDTRCVGALTGTFDNVVVPRNATCTLTNSTVKGNVKALQNSRLTMINDQVGGNVEGDKAQSVQVVVSLVNGNIKISEAGDPVFLSALVLLTDLPNGNIQIEKGRFPNGDWIVESNDVGKGNIQVVENGSIFLSYIFDNIVAEDVQVFKNFGSGPKFVVFNTIGENLQCKENTPPFTGAPNTVGGNAEDQCAGSGTLAASSFSSSVAAAVAAGNFPLKRTK